MLYTNIIWNPSANHRHWWMIGIHFALFFTVINSYRIIFKYLMAVFDRFKVRLSKDETISWKIINHILMFRRSKSFKSVHTKHHMCSRDEEQLVLKLSGIVKQASDANTRSKERFKLRSCLPFSLSSKALINFFSSISATQITWVNGQMAWHCNSRIKKVREVISDFNRFAFIHGFCIESR